MEKYRDASAPVDQRVDDLVRRMTLEEKVAQLCAVLPQMLLDGVEVAETKLEKFMTNGIGRIPQFPMPFHESVRQIGEAYNAIQRFTLEKTRLGIPFMAQVECLNGVVAVDATSFPSPIATAASWDPDAVHSAAEAIGRQMRMMVNGANALAPVVDLARDPRWGRVYETYGESSYLNALFGIAFVTGLQHDDDLKRGVQSCAKHFLGYSYTQGGLNSAPIETGFRELYEAFARPFEAMIHDAGLRSVMCTYSEIDGKPVSVSPEILRGLLRDRMGFQGSAVCDGGSIERTCTTQHTAVDMKEAAVMALAAGLDADTPRSEAYPHLSAAVREGLVEERIVDEACRRVLRQKFELGLFDDPYVDTARLEQGVATPEDEALSLDLSRKAITLLKNENGLLPLSKNAGTVAVIGPHGSNVIDLFGGYTFPSMLEAVSDRESGFSMLGVNEGVAEAEKESGRRSVAVPDNFVEAYCRKRYGVRSLAEELGMKLQDGAVRYSRGCNIDDDDRSMFAAALEVARAADLIVMTMGGKSGWTNAATSGEGRDRASLDLPGVQEDLLEEVTALGKPVILVLFHGRPMSINWAASHVGAILDVWFPGPHGGRAIADVLVGDYNPGGKLPVTVPRSVGQVPIYHDHKAGAGYRRDAGRGGISLETLFGGGYTDIPSDPLYHFGFGLSYTSFAFSGFTVSPAGVRSDGAVRIAAVVENTGRLTGDEVVQFYVRDCEAKVTRPVMELVGFKRVTLAPGEKVRVELELAMSQLGFLNEDMELVVEPGRIEVMIGSSSNDIHHRAMFRITGEKRRLEGRRSYAARLTLSRL